MSYFKKNYKKICIYALCLGVIFILGMYNIKYQYAISIIDDEFGYWGAAAQLSGKNWVELLSTSFYYAWGYGLLLVPLFHMGLDSSLMLQMAIILNICLLMSSFLLTNYIAQQLFGKINKVILIFLSFIVTIYSNNLFQVNFGWSETLLYFLFWCIAVFVWRVMKFGKWVDYLVLSILSVYIYTVHHRAVGVLFIVFMFLVFYYLKSIIQKHPLHKILFSILLIVLLFLTVTVFKEYVISNWYSNNHYVAVNDYEGQTGKVVSLFRVKGFIFLVLSFAGKLFYQGASSFLLVFISLSLVIKMTYERCLNYFSKKKDIVWNNKQWFMLYCVVTFVMEILISAIYKSGAISSLRANDIIYGRYAEFAIGPMLLLGVGILFENYRYVKEVAFSIAVFILCSIAVIMQFVYTKNMYVNALCISGIVGFFNNNDRPEIIVLKIFIVSITGFLMIYIASVIYHKNKTNFFKGLLLGTMLVIGAIWCYRGMSEATHFVRHKQSESIEYVADIDLIVDELSEETQLYYVVDDSDSRYNFLKVLQFLQVNRTIHVLSQDEFSEFTDNEGVFLSSLDHEIMNYMKKTTELKYQTERLCIYAKDKSEINEELNLIISKKYNKK